MKIKSEKGITGIDITVSILVITIFISLIGVLIFNINAQSASIERRTEAAYQAVNLIEEMKGKTIEELEALTDEEKNGYIDGTPYTKQIEVIDYKDMTEENKQDDTIQAGILKKVTVTVLYKDGADTEEISLSGIVTRYSGTE